MAAYHALVQVDLSSQCCIASETKTHAAHQAHRCLSSGWALLGQEMLSWTTPRNLLRPWSLRLGQPLSKKLMGWVKHWGKMSMSNAE